MTWSEIKNEALSRLSEYTDDHPDRELQEINEILQSMLVDTKDVRILRMQRVSSLPVQTDSAPVYLPATGEGSVLGSRFAQFLFNGDYDKTRPPYTNMYILQDPDK